MEKDHAISFRTDAATATQLDELRRAADDLPTRGEMIRRLIRDAYERQTAARPKKK